MKHCEFSVTFLLFNMHCTFPAHLNSSFTKLMTVWEKFWFLWALETNLLQSVCVRVLSAYLNSKVTLAKAVS